MHKRFSFLFFLFIFITVSFFVTTLAQSASIKERMVARIPTIISLKDKGIIGENNVGLLEYRGSNKPQQELIAAENKDRKIIYVAIGKKQGADPLLVAKRRAKKIVSQGKAGHWFQKEDGSWYKK